MFANFKLFLVMTALIFFTACGDDDRQKEPEEKTVNSDDQNQIPATEVTGTFLLVENFKVNFALYPLEESEVREIVGGLSILKNPSLSQRKRYAAEPGCPVRQDAVSLEEGGIVLRYFSTDEKCPENENELNIDIRYVRIKCSTTDISSLAEESASTLLGDYRSLCPHDEEMTLIENQQIVYASVIDENLHQEVISSAWMTSDGKDCEYKNNGGNVSVDDCSFYQKHVVADKQIFEEPFIFTVAKFEMNNVTGQIDRTQYDSGDVSIELNNWNGSLTYHPDKLASYTLRNNENKLMTGELGGGRSYSGGSGSSGLLKKNTSRIELDKDTDEGSSKW